MILQFVPSGTEVLVVLAIVILLFGASRIPKLARSTGQAMGEFRRGRVEVEEELEEMENPEGGPDVEDTAADEDDRDQE